MSGLDRRHEPRLPGFRVGIGGANRWSEEEDAVLHRALAALPHRRPGAVLSRLKKLIEEAE